MSSSFDIHTHNSKCRVLVYSHSVLANFFNTDSADPSRFSPPTTAEKFKGISTSKREEILKEIQANPANFVNRALRSTDYPSTDISLDVIELSFTKTISGPAGQFSMLLVPRSNYIQELNPDDLVIIELDNAAGEVTSKGLVSVCLIDRVSNQRRANPNFTTTDRVAVYGRDLGKILLETSVSVDTSGLFLVELARKFLDQKSVLQGSGNKLGLLGSPSDIVVDIFTTYSQIKLKPKVRIPKDNDRGFDLVDTIQGVRPLQQFVFPGNVGVNLAQLINTDKPSNGFVEDTLGGLAEVVLPKSGVTLWHLMDQYANRLVNEMFVDIRETRELEGTVEDQGGTPRLVSRKEFIQDVDYKIALVMRQYPFDKDAFNSLPLNSIEDHEILEFDIGKSSHNIKNVFQTWLFNHGIPSLADQRWPLLIALESVARHGIKHYIGESQYPWPTATPGAANSASDAKNLKNVAARASAFDVATKYLELISTWNAANEEFVEGTIVLRLRPRIRVGERVYVHTYDGNSYQFYVEAVTHHFAYPGVSLTTLTVTRGIPKVVHNRPISSPVDRLELGHLGEIGPTFIGFESITGQARVIKDFTKFQTDVKQTVVDANKSIEPFSLPKNAKDRIDAVKLLCEKYKTSPVPASTLYGVCGAESSFGGNRVNPTSSAAGIMQVFVSTANSPDVVGSPLPPNLYPVPVTLEQLLQNDDLNMLVGAKVLNAYYASIVTHTGITPSVAQVYVAYRAGVGKMNAFLKGTASPAVVAEITTKLADKPTSSAVSYANSYYPPTA